MQPTQLILKSLTDGLNLESHWIAAGGSREENTPSWKAPTKCSRGLSEFSFTSWDYMLVTE